MPLDLDPATRRALVDELKRSMTGVAQKVIAHDVAATLGQESSTWVSLLSLVLKKDEVALRRAFAPERADDVLATICHALGLDVETTLRAARHRAAQRAHVAPDRHPAWIELADATPWLEDVPWIANNTSTLQKLLERERSHVTWLGGGAGSGKSAQLWRAARDGLGQIVAPPWPDHAPFGTRWLVDEPPDPAAVIAHADHAGAILVIATRQPPAAARDDLTIELAPWRRREIRTFLEQLEVRVEPGLGRIVDKLARLDLTMTPLELGHLVRLLVDHPALLDEDIRELQVRAALYGLGRHAALPDERERQWHAHGRRVYAVAAAAAVRAAGAAQPIAGIEPSALRAALDAVPAVLIGGDDGEPLRETLRRARGEAGTSSKAVLKLLDTWAGHLTGAGWIALLAEAGAWRLAGGWLTPGDARLALQLAAERLDHDWMWRQLRATLASAAWAPARFAWASRLRDVPARLDELLATDAACHVGALELAIALVAFNAAPVDTARIERTVFSALLVASARLLFIQHLEPDEQIRHALQVASRRYHRSLPAVSSWTDQDLGARCTQAARLITRQWPSEAPARDWRCYATLVPWQVLPALREPAKLAQLRDDRFDPEAILAVYADSGDAWARAVMIGDVDDHHGALVSWRGRLAALERWGPPRDLQRHARIVAWLLAELARSTAVIPPTLRRRVVEAVTQLVRRDPDRAVSARARARHDDLWRAALEQAQAIRPLRAWFDAERAALARRVRAAPRRGLTFRAARLRIARIIQLGVALHRCQVRAPLRELILQAERTRRVVRVHAAWQLAVEAAAALIQQRDGDELDPILAHGDTAAAAAITAALARDDHDDDTVRWIADRLAHRVRDALDSLNARPELRHLARRWAEDATRDDRRVVAAHWLLAHPRATEHDADRVRWLFTQLPIARSVSHVGAALDHPDEAIQHAAVGLLGRALDDIGPSGTLAALAGCFEPARPTSRRWHWWGTRDISLHELTYYVRRVIEHGHSPSPDRIRHLMTLIQQCDHVRYCWDGDIANLAAEVAVAARRLALTELPAWLRAPARRHGDRVQAAMIRAILMDGRPHDLDRALLEAIAEIDDSSAGEIAHDALIARDRPSDDQLLDEWRAAPDTVIVERGPVPARHKAIEWWLRHRAPNELARHLADRLLALPPELREFGVKHVRRVAELAPDQAARLAPLFERRNGERPGLPRPSTYGVRRRRKIAGSRAATASRGTRSGPTSPAP